MQPTKPTCTVNTRARKYWELPGTDLCWRNRW